LNRPTLRICAFAASLGGLAACSSNSTTSPNSAAFGTAACTFAGQTLTVQSALPSTGTPVNVRAEVATIIFLTNIANVCSLIAANPNQNIHDSQYLTIVVITPLAVVPGTFNIFSDSLGMHPSYATVYYETDNATCDPAVEEDFASRPVTIATISSSDITDSYDITMNLSVSADFVNPNSNGDHVTGSFSAPICAAFVVAAGCPDRRRGVFQHASLQSTPDETQTCPRESPRRII
jgi:hypothetical protein